MERVQGFLAPSGTEQAPVPYHISDGSSECSDVPKILISVLLLIEASLERVFRTNENNLFLSIPAFLITLIIIVR